MKSHCLLLTATAALAAAYTCDLKKNARPLPSGVIPVKGKTPSQVLAAAASYTSGPALKSTEYSYTAYQDGEKMVFQTDCSCYLDYLTNQFMPTAYNAVPKDNTVQPPVPRARSWTDYFKGLSAAAQDLAASSLRGSTNAELVLSVAAGAAPWQAITDITQVQPGDVIAYELPPGSTDTGHVMIAINSTDYPSTISPSDNPYPSQYAAAYWAYVADASSVLHQNDTRGPGKPFTNGVGRGLMRFYTDKNNRPLAFQFAKNDNVHADTIAMGRPMVF